MLANIVIAGLAQVVPVPPPPAACDPFVIFFGAGSATVPGSYQQTIETIVSLREQARSHIEIVGFADALGSEAYNLKLSRQRAEAVREALAREGFPRQFMHVDAIGERRLLVETERPEARNRRAAICFY